MDAQVSEIADLSASAIGYLAPRLLAETLPGGQACAAPHGTVTFDICPSSGRLWISWESDEDPHPEDWQMVMQFADACASPGSAVRCYERYEAGRNIMICFIEPDSALGQVARAMSIF